MTPLVALSVAVAGAIGSVARYLVTLVLPHDARRGLPWGVLAVNVIGSLTAGVLLGVASRSALSPEWMLALSTGFCGGLTTFSTFSVETVQLVQRRRHGAAVASILLNIVAGVGAAAAGFVLAG